MLKLKTSVAVIALMALSTTTAFSQNANLHDIEIKAQKLTTALTELSDATQLQFIYSPELLEGIKTDGVSGKLDSLSVLKSLLENTNLTLRKVDQTTYIIQSASEGDDGYQNISYGENYQENLAVLEGDETADDTAYSNVFDEIVVTATRRETSIQSTAASINAFSGQKLAEMGYNNVGQFIDSVPGVTAVAEGPGNTRIIIRNVATSTQESGSPTTATYFDDFALGNSGSNIRLIDVERVEVLKGPQGTLYGRSAMGGIVRYISNKPNTEEIEGGINIYSSDVTDGGTNYGGHGYLNLPISDVFAIRMAGYYYNNAGFIDNVELGVKDHNKEETFGGRIAAHWDVSDTFTVDFTYLNQEVDGAPNWVTTTRDPGGLNVPFDEGPDIPFDIEARTSVAGVIQKEISKQRLMNLKLENDFESFTATFLATRTDDEFGFVFDQREFLGLPFGCVCDALPSDSDNYRIDQQTDILELRLVSSGEDAVDWIFGLYYEDSKTREDQIITWYGPDLSAFGGLLSFLGNEAILFDNITERTSEEKAAYGEVGFNITSDTKLTVGYRYSKIESSDELTRGEGGLYQALGRDLNLGIPFTTDENVSTYKIALEHSFNDDVFAYASATSGYRRGGVNPATLNSDASAFDSDTLWNYEVGLKTVWLDGRLIANVAAYYLDYNDIQLVVQDPVTFVRGTQNVGKARISGLELGLNLQVNEYIDVSFNGSLSDPELREDVPGGDTGLKGDRLPGSAKESFTIAANLNLPLNDGLDIFGNITYKYVGNRYNSFNLDLDVELPSYQMMDVRLGVRSEEGYSVSLFAHNLFDEAAIFVIDRQGPFFESVPTNRPRTIGINVTYDF